MINPLDAFKLKGGVLVQLSTNIANPQLVWLGWYRLNGIIQFP